MNVINTFPRLKLFGAILISTTLMGCVIEEEIAENTDAENQEQLEQNDQPADGDTSGFQTLSGKVAIGYLVNAIVCLDINANGACDLDEPSAITTVGGEFAISGLTSSQVSEHPLLVEVKAGETYDEDNSDPSIKIGSSFSLSAPANSKFISPFTTILKFKMDSGKSYSASVDELKSILGVHFDPSVDYLAALASNELSEEERETYTTAVIVSKFMGGTLAVLTNAGEVPMSFAAAVMYIEQNFQQLMVVALDDSRAIDGEIPEQNPEDIPDIVNPECELCGLWNLEFEEHDGSLFDIYIVIDSMNGTAKQFINIYAGGQDQCVQSTQSISTTNLGTIWRLAGEHNPEGLLSLVTSNQVKFLMEDESLLFNRVDAMANPCGALYDQTTDPESPIEDPTLPLEEPSVPDGTDQYPIEGVWIAEYTDGRTDIAGAYIAYENGTGMFLDGFELNNPNCEDWEMEFNWSITEALVLTIAYNNVVNGELSLEDGEPETEIFTISNPLQDSADLTALYYEEGSQFSAENPASFHVTRSALLPSEIKAMCTSGF